MRMADPRGSDVRLLLGQLDEPRVSRQPIPVCACEWQVIQRYA